MNLNYGDNNLDTLFLIQCSSFWFRSSSEESAQSRIGCSDLGLVQATDDLDELGHHPMWTVLHVITVIDLDFDFSHHHCPTKFSSNIQWIRERVQGTETCLVAKGLHHLMKRHQYSFNQISSVIIKEMNKLTCFSFINSCNFIYNLIWQYFIFTLDITNLKGS